MTSPTPRMLQWRTVSYRVVRRVWRDPLDTSFSTRVRDRRWNTDRFEALYACGSEGVARAVTLDLFRFSGLVLEDLRRETQPQLVEVGWYGSLVDVCTAEGVHAAGFAEAYPAGVDRAVTRQAAVRWHEAGLEGVACRSASLGRMGQTSWQGPVPEWSEIALWRSNWKKPPKLVRRREDDLWLVRQPASQK